MSAKGFCMFASGLLTGAAIGVAAGILFAPESGEDTRRNISDNVTEFYYDTYDKFLEWEDQLKDQAAQTKAYLEEQFAKLTGKVETAVEDFSGTISDFEEKIEAVVDDDTVIEEEAAEAIAEEAPAEEAVEVAEKAAEEAEEAAQEA